MSGDGSGAGCGSSSLSGNSSAYNPQNFSSSTSHKIPLGNHSNMSDDSFDSDIECFSSDGTPFVDPVRNPSSKSNKPARVKLPRLPNESDADYHRRATKEGVARYRERQQMLAAQQSLKSQPTEVSNEARKRRSSVSVSTLETEALNAQTQQCISKKYYKHLSKDLRSQVLQQQRQIANLQEEINSLKTQLATHPVITTAPPDPALQNLGPSISAAPQPSTTSAPQQPPVASAFANLLSQESISVPDLMKQLEQQFQAMIDTLLSSVAQRLDTRQPRSAGQSQDHQRKRSRSTRRTTYPALLPPAAPRNQPRISYAKAAEGMVRTPSASINTATIATADTARLPFIPGNDDDYQTVHRKKKKRTFVAQPPKTKETQILVVPEDSSKNVLDLLRKLPDINPRNFGVKNVINLPSGGALVTCQTKEQTSALSQAVAGASGVQIKKPTTRPAEFRIHSVPIETSATELQEDIERTLGHKALGITFVLYKKPSVPGTKMAVCQVPLSTYRTACDLSRIRIGWTFCELRTLPYISRCTRCGLLGHHTDKCQAPTETEISIHKPEDPCHDCTTHNNRVKLAKLPSQKRSVSHPTGHRTCPTLLALRRGASNFVDPPDYVPPVPTTDVPTNLPSTQPMDGGSIMDVTDG